MAKILVADDNSNIQKMVGLALKDQGIDVVAVGNGEAAVRKISDLRPDLVLADVFMPVRNGYEVCQFVKTDSSLSHIPVILLVGAFDPLDEQEAQRVGADGVLKKPFVPPDPLISMVKSALQRAGVITGPVGGAKSEEPEPLRAADLLTPGPAPVPTVKATPVEHEEFMVSGTEESVEDEVPERPKPVRIDSSAQHAAFGSLLDTPSPEAEEDSFVSSVPEDFAVRNWHSKDEEEREEEEEEEHKPASWRHDEAESYAGSQPEKSKRIDDWRVGSFEQIASRKSGSGWEPEEEKPELVDPAAVASNSVVAPPPPPPRPTPVQEAAPVPVPTKPFGMEPTPAVPAEPSTPEPAAKTATIVEEVATPALEAPRSATPEPAKTEAAPVKAEPQKKETRESWFSTSTSPWDAEIQKASQLAATWDAPVEPSAPAASDNGTEKPTETLSEETQAVIEQAALPPATVEAIREEAALVTEEAAVEQTEAPIYRSSYSATVEDLEPLPEGPDAAPSNMDDLVAKVLSKMTPDVLQAVTREILKPVVEAMVKEELKSKK